MISNWSTDWQISDVEIYDSLSLIQSRMQILAYILEDPWPSDIQKAATNMLYEPNISVFVLEVASLSW